jgi:hypothetical protein
MIDKTKWDTGQAFMAGVLGREAPRTQCPYLPKALHRVDEDEPIDAIRPNLEAGPGVDAPMYYGCWRIWKQADGLYAGELMQYRNMTDKFVDATLDDAMAKASEWHAVSYG